MNGERCVCDLVQAVGLGWSTTSKHLEVLREAGVVASEKRGQKVFYRLELDCVGHFIDCLDEPASAAPPGTSHVTAPEDRRRRLPWLH